MYVLVLVSYVCPRRGVLHRLPRLYTTEYDVRRAYLGDVVLTRGNEVTPPNQVGICAAVNTPATLIYSVTSPLASRAPPHNPSRSLDGTAWDRLQRA